MFKSILINTFSTISIAFYILQCLGSRIAKRLRLRRGECSTSRTEESATESKKHHHGHHRRHSSGHRQGAWQDLISQYVQSLGKVAEPVVKAATENITPSAPPQSGGQPKADAQVHCKNAEKYAKASIDILSNLAQNFTNMMDPFAASFAFDGPDLCAQYGNEANAKTSAQSPPSAQAAPTVPSVSVAAPSTAANDKPTEKPPAEKKQDTEKPLNEQQQKPQSTELPLDQRIEISVDDTAALFPIVAATPASAPATAPESMSSNKSTGSDGPHKEIPRDWTLLDADDMFDTVQAVASADVATNTASAQNSNSNGGAIPKAVSSEATETKKQPDYEELSRALRSHIEEFQQIFKTTGKEEGNSKKTQTPPSTPDAQATRHPDPRVNESLGAMLAMGFSNEGGWLSQLLECVKGDIPRALDLLQPQK